MKYHYSFSENFRLFFLRLFRLHKEYSYYHKCLMYRDLKNEVPHILNILNELNDKRGTLYWLTWGSLLGYYREHGVIFGDNDLDLGMFCEDISCSFVDDLIEKGFEFSEAIIDNDYRGFHIAFYYKNVKVDLYSFKRSNDNKEFVGFAPGPYKGKWIESKRHNIYLNKWFYFPYTGMRKTEFLGVSTMVPENDRNILEILYGKEFMTPIPGYKASANDYILIDSVEVSFSRKYSYNEFKELKKRGVI